MNRKIVLIVLIMGITIACSAQFAGGEGTRENPWQIAAADHLDNIRNYLGLENSDKHFIQTADIDLGVPPWNEGEGWLPIGDVDNRFFGSYDGDGRQITNLTIRRRTDNTGLFGYIQGSLLTSLRLVGVNINAWNNNTGALAGIAISSSIGDCQVQGEIRSRNGVGGIVGSINGSILTGSSFDGLIIGRQLVGGITGYNNNEAEINNCYTKGLIIGQSAVGGIVGSNRLDSLVNESYSTMAVQGIVHSQSGFGGLVGSNNNANVIGSYAAGSISPCSTASNVGGVVGNFNDGLVEASFWNSETTGIDESPQGTALTTEQMTSAEQFGGWNFQEVWQISENSYPWLRWQERSYGHNIPGPYNLTAVGSDEDNTVDLSWQLMANQDAPSFFRVYRNNRLIAQVNYPLNEYQDTEVAATYIQRYYVTAVIVDDDEEKETAASNTRVVFLYDSFPGGDGSPEDPYQVNSATTLTMVRNDPEAHYIQTADIDLGVYPWNEGTGWVPIGYHPHSNNHTLFTGSYDGNGYVIKNLKSDAGFENRGLFCIISNAVVKNLGLINVDIRGTNRVGGIAGQIIDDSVVKYSFVTGNVYGGNHVGGIVGRMGTNEMGSAILNSYSSAVVSTENTSNLHSIGGLLGYRYRGDVIGNYSVGPVYSLVESVNANAVIGANSTREGEVRDNYWNTETTLKQRGANRIEIPGSTTAEMMQQETFTGFDFEEIWRIDENSSFPYLSWQGDEADEHNLPSLLPPVNLTADSGHQRIMLAWEAPNQEMGVPDGYNIYRNEVKINQELITENEYSDTELRSWTNYRYQITAVYGEDESWPGNIAISSAIYFAGGSGTEEDPYLIETAEQLDGIRYVAAGHFRQIADISLSGFEDWNPIIGEYENFFSGSYDGDGFVITDLTMDRGSHRGLFGALVGASITNVGIENVSMTNIVSGGVLAVSARESSISHSYASGGFLLGGMSAVGGFIGIVANEAEIIDCWADINVSGYSEVGGFVGKLQAGSMIQRCFSKGSVTARTPCSRQVGGFTGFNHNGTIIDSYTRSAVNAAETVMSVGGFAGFMVGGTITNCYAAGELNSGEQAGGLIGGGAGTANNSYWDMEVSGYQNSLAGEGRYSRQMVYPHSQDTYRNWDFDEIWQNDWSGEHNDGYPIIHWQSSEDLPYPDTATNPLPENEADDVCIDLEKLAWSYTDSPLFAEPVGFRVYFSDNDEFDEDSPYVWIPYNQEQEEYSTSDILPPVLGFSTFYYWKVVPTTIYGGDDQVSDKKQRQNSESRISQNSEMSQLRIAESPHRQSSKASHRHIAAGVDAPNVPVWWFMTTMETAADYDAEVPLITELYANHPNPFNPETTISFSLAEAGEVTLEIFNIKGQRIVKLVDEYREAGIQRVAWNGKDEYNRTVGSGIYLYRMKAGDYNAAAIMILMK